MLLFFIFSFLQAPKVTIAQNNDKNITKNVVLVAKDTIYNQRLITNNLDSLLSSIQEQYQSKGYLAFSIDSSAIIEDTFFYYFFKGQQFFWKYIIIDSSVVNILNSSNIDLKIKNGDVVNMKQLDVLNQAILRYQEKNGKPFSQIQFKNTAVNNEQKLSTEYIVANTKTLLLDTVIIHAEFPVYKPFLLTYLGIKEKEVYNPEVIKTIPKSINLLPFATISKPHEVKYLLGKTELNIYLKERKVNTINALIGVQPIGQTGKYQITADANATIKNYFGMGESLDFSYNQIQGATRRMNTALEFPYLLGTRFGIDGKFNYFQQDTTFRKVEGTLGVSYFINALSSFNVYGSYATNRLITIDTQFIRINKSLPKNVDVTSIGSGITFKFRTIDNIIIPRKGWEFMVNGLINRRKFIKNNTITSIVDGTGYDYSRLYDSLNVSDLQYKVQGAIAYYQPITKSIGIKSVINSAYLSPKRLFYNELFQIGGFKLLRGFNELSLFVQQYHLITLEPRFFLTQESFAYIFTDAGIVTTQDILKQFNYNKVISFGVGGMLTTDNGIFNIAIGVGKLGDERLRFGNATVHFGYALRF